MIRELRIENLLLIERAELRFGPGLNVITGETGAGKTVLAHSLDLLLGGKPRAGIVRPGAEEAWVEGCFELPAGLAEREDLSQLVARLPPGEEVILARRVSAAGRSTAFVAGRAASAADLRALGGALLSFYGQHEHRRLTLASVQAEVLDSFAGAEHLDLRERYRLAHREVVGLEAELAAAEGADGARERDLDVLRFELDEIDGLAPDPGEHAELLAERDRLSAVDELRIAAAEALATIAPEDGEGGARPAVAAADAAARRAAGSDPELDRIAERIGAIDAELEDLGGELRGYAERLESDPERLEAVEGRLAGLDRLLRKHGNTIEAVLEHAERCRAEIDRLAYADARLEQLAAELERSRERREDLAAELSGSRGAAAPHLERRLAEALDQLAMPGATLAVELRPHPDGFGPSGAESIELMVATNAGLPPAPLGDTASGGELSRVMLALAGLGAEDGSRALVFDEIDAGIGGKVARRVGERLRELADRSQVICITHLPQVASLASAHFRVVKEAEADGGTARATIDAVGGEQLVAEIVRMLGADVDDAGASTHARELLAA